VSEFTGRRTIHVCVDIEGVLRCSDKQLSKLFIEDDGSHRPGRYVRDWLRMQLAQGKRVLPAGKPCEGFSYQTGCPGHPVVSEEVAE
jgi:hypothetical protein